MFVLFVDVGNLIIIAAKPPPVAAFVVLTADLGMISQMSLHIILIRMWIQENIRLFIVNSKYYISYIYCITFIHDS